MEMLDIVRGQITTLPKGWNISQLNATQPTTQYGDFVDKILREIAAVIQMPFGIAAGDFGGSNYSSGRLDVMRYQRKIICRRASLNRHVDRIFSKWLDEALLIPGYLTAPLDVRKQATRRKWHWDAFAYVDPEKEAQAIQILLQNYAITLDDVFASRGEDAMTQLENIATLREEMKKLGLPMPEDLTKPAAKGPAPGGDAAKEVASASAA
jgi:capsid protein